MLFYKLEIPEVIYIEPEIIADKRGYFFEAYHQKKYQENGITLDFVQDNQSSSVQGTLRGLHYQTGPHAQGKLVRVLAGEIFDVAVDVRKNSKYYGKWVAKKLSAAKKNMLYIPPGFAHGFYVLSDHAEMLYKCTALYHPASEKTILWNDPTLNITWPILKDHELILSEKDKLGENLD